MGIAFFFLFISKSFNTLLDMLVLASPTGLHEGKYIPSPSGRSCFALC